MENNAQPAQAVIHATQEAINPVLTQLTYPQPQQLMCVLISYTTPGRRGGHRADES